MGSLRQRTVSQILRLPLQLKLAAVVLIAAAVSAGISSRSARLAVSASEPAMGGTDVSEQETPAKPIEDAYEAARKGDIGAYINEFAGGAQSALRQVRSEKGD